MKTKSNIIPAVLFGSAFVALMLACLLGVLDHTLTLGGGLGLMGAVLSLFGIGTFVSLED